LEERFTHRELGYFFGAENRDDLEGDLADEVTRDVFDLLWKVMALPAVEAFSCFQE